MSIPSITAPAGDWAAALAAVLPAVSRKPPVPVLSMVRVDVISDRVYLTATDYQLTARTSFEHSGVNVDGARFLVDARDLAGAIRTLTGRAKKEPVTVTFTDLTDYDLEKFRFVGHVTVEARGYSVRIGSAHRPDYPEAAKLPGGPSAVLMGVDLARAVARGVPSTDTYPVLESFRFKFDGHALKIVSTDRYRIAEDTILSGAKIDGEYLVPSRALRDIAKFLVGDVVFATGEETVGITSGATSYVINTVAGEYPTIESLLAFEPEWSYTINAARLDEALFIVERFVPRNLPTTLTFTEHGITATYEDVFGPSTAPALPVAHVGDVPNQSFNPGYLRFGINAHRKNGVAEVQVQGTRPGKPVIITDPVAPGYRYLLMPVRMPTQTP